MDSQQAVKPRWQIGDVALILLALAGFVMLNGLWSDSLKKLLIDRFGGQYGQLGYFALITSFQGFMMVGLVFYFAKSKGQGSAELGFRIPSLTQVLLYGVVGGLVLLVLGISASQLIEFLSPRPPQPQPIAQAIAKAGSWRQLLLPMGVASIVAPISEELYLRGFTYPVLRKHFGIKVGMVITALFFAALHFDLLRFFPLAIAGWALTWLYQKTGSLITSMLAHGIWNSLMTLLVYLGY